MGAAGYGLFSTSVQAIFYRIFIGIGVQNPHIGSFIRHISITSADHDRPYIYHIQLVRGSLCQLTQEGSTLQNKPPYSNVYLATYSYMRWKLLGSNACYVLQPISVEL
jgi:hypothetical protein